MSKYVMVFFKKDEEAETFIEKAKDSELFYWPAKSIGGDYKNISPDSVWRIEDA